MTEGMKWKWKWRPSRADWHRRSPGPRRGGEQLGVLSSFRGSHSRFIACSGVYIPTARSHGVRRCGIFLSLHSKFRFRACCSAPCRIELERRRCVALVQQLCVSLRVCLSVRPAGGVCARARTCGGFGCRRSAGGESVGARVGREERRVGCGDGGLDGGVVRSSGGTFVRSRRRLLGWDGLGMGVGVRHRGFRMCLGC